MNEPALRRAALRAALPDRALLLLGQAQTPRNYQAATYPFRQDSHFLYFTGLSRPDLALLVDPQGNETLFAPAEDPGDLIWHGPQPSVADLARSAGIARVEESGRLPGALAALAKAPVHYLPPYRDDRVLRLAALLGRPPAEVPAHASPALARAVAALRARKDEGEIREIEAALAATAAMYRAAFQRTRPGAAEAEVAGAMHGAAMALGCGQAFQPIVSVRGEVLHNESFAGTLREGGLLVVDSGAERPSGYASDITRTLPVSGRFSERQRGLYQVVLAAQEAAIGAARPGVSNRELHLLAARTIAAGLGGLGLMKGDPEQAVAEGAHALFFPHGLGHMLGLDVHDMEDLGDLVGYPEGEARSPQFGLCYLRLARALEPGFVLTVEPGIYFIPALIERWAAEKRHNEFIDYRNLDAFRGFGGIRIEDDILITDTGCRVLGPGIPKTPEAVEEAMEAARSR